MRYWLLKSEPSCFSIDDLQQSPNQTTHWDGVRNYQARNYLRDQMQPGDAAFFYHSNCKTPGITGIVKIISNAYPDYTAFDPNSEHPDLSSNPDNPRWFMVDVQFVEKFENIISLAELKQHPELHQLALLKKGNRLSVSTISEQAWNYIMSIFLLSHKGAEQDNEFHH